MSLALNIGGKVLMIGGGAPTIGGGGGGGFTANRVGNAGGTPSDYGGLPYFQDRMMEARGFMTTSNLAVFTTLDANGWPTTDFGTYLTETQNFSIAPSWNTGTYKCGYTSKNGGAETIAGIGGATISSIVNTAGVVTFNLVPPSAVVAMGFKITGTTGGVTNVFAMLPAYGSNVSSNISGTYTNLFTNEWLAKASQLSVQRSLEWSNVKWNTSSNTWSQRNTPANTKTSGNWGTNWTVSSSGTEGFPVDWFVALCNQTNTGIWYNIPLNDPSNSYAAGLASYLYANLNTNLPIYIELANELWNGVGTGGGTYSNAATNAGFTGANAPANYLAYRLYGIATAFSAVFGASFGTRCKIVMAWQTGGNGLNVVTQAYSYLKTTYGTPSNYVHCVAIAPYATRDCSSVPASFGYGTGGTNYINTNASIVNIQKQLSDNSGYQSFFSLSESFSLTAQRNGAQLVAYESGWETASGETTSVVNLGAAIMDSGMTAVVESYITAMFNSGYQQINWTVLGVQNTGSVLDPNYGTSNDPNGFVTSGSPRMTGLTSFSAGPPVPTRNVVSGSGSIIDCINFVDTTSLYSAPGIAAGVYPYFGQINSYQSFPYSVGGYIGYLINCTAPATYTLALAPITSSTGTTNVEVNGTVVYTGVSLPTGGTGTTYTNLGSVTLRTGQNYVLLGNGSTQTGVQPKYMRFT